MLSLSVDQCFHQISQVGDFLSESRHLVDLHFLQELLLVGLKLHIENAGQSFSVFFVILLSALLLKLLCPPPASMGVFFQLSYFSFKGDFVIIGKNLYTGCPKKTGISVQSSF